MSSQKLLPLRVIQWQDSYLDMLQSSIQQPSTRKILPQKLVQIQPFHPSQHMHHNGSHRSIKLQDSKPSILSKNSLTELFTKGNNMIDRINSNIIQTQVGDGVTPPAKIVSNHHPQSTDSILLHCSRRCKYSRRDCGQVRN